jgi:DNA-binding transcriptional LysR family regulator
MIVTATRLKHLMSVAHHRHFGLAAASLGISQPALTKSIQGLEASLGVKLLDRERSGVVLTVFGEMVLQHGRELLHGQSEMLRNLRLLANLDIGLVKATFGPYPSVISGYPAAGRLLARHPGLKFSLHVENWREARRAVLQEQVDFGVAELNELELDPSIEFEALAQHNGRFFCRPDHPLLAQRQIQLADLRQYPWACTRVPSRIATGFPRDACAAGHIDPLTGDFIPSVEIDVPIHLGSLIADNDVLVVASLALMERELEARTVSVVPSPTLPGRYAIFWPRSRSPSPSMLAYMREIRAVESEFAQREAHLATVYQDLIAPRRG